MSTSPPASPPATPGEAAQREGQGREADRHQAHRLQAVGAATSGLAHDLDNLLQGVLGCVVVARNERTPPEDAQRLLARAEAALRRGRSLVDQLGRFTRRQPLELRPVSLDAVLAESLPLVQRLVGDAILVEHEPGAGAGRMLADPVQIEQIVLNLAANARDAMPSGGRLRLATAEIRDVQPVGGNPRRYLRLVVTDTGCGMGPELRARIFEPFFTTKAAGEGTGLGLATVSAITRALEGEVEVHSSRGEGTAFHFLFPRVDAPA